MPFLAINIEGDRGDDRLKHIGADRRENLPVCPPVLTGWESHQCLALLPGGLFVDDRAGYAVALMYCSRPPDGSSETRAVQSSITEICRP